MARRATTPAAGSTRAGYWREKIEKWQASGQTPEAFCRQRHVNAGTFGWWRSRLGASVKRVGVLSSRTPASADSSSGFLEVRRPTAGGDVGSSGYEVVLANGRRIVIRGDFDDATLRRLIAAAERSC